MRDAFEALTGHDLVVGPTHDGGYYLVGAKAAHPTLFDGDGMGTKSALEALLARAHGQQLSVASTDPFYDIDVESDLTRLAEELRLAPARAPRTAAWLKHWRQQWAQLRTAHGKPVKLTPSRRLYVLGIVMLVALTICSGKFGSMGAPSFVIPLAVAGIAYLLAIRELFSTATFPRHVIVIGLVLAALWHLAFLRMPPGSDDDIHRYVWDGRVQRLGYSPYVVVPSDPALGELHTAETRTLNNPDLPSPYPAGAELFFRAVTAIHESVFALKVAFVVCDFAIVLVLLDILRRCGQGAHWVLAYAWNPLLAVEVAGSGHIDIVGALLLLVSFAALGRRWRAVAALAFGLAVAVKLLPIVLLPLYWRRVRMRDATLAVIVVGLLYVPFLNHGRVPIGSLGTYVQSFRFNDPVFAMLERRGGSAGCSWAGSARGLSYRNLDEAQGPTVFSGRIRLAHGSIASVCTGRISVVPSVAAALRPVGVDGAHHHLDSQHHPNLLCLAFADAWTSVASCRVGLCCWNTDPW